MLDVSLRTFQPNMTKKNIKKLLRNIPKEKISL
jgi:hypothetical protein